MTNLTLHLPSLSDLGRETGLDGLDRTTRAARVASNEVKTVLSLGKICVGRSAGLAGDVLDNVRAQDVLDLLLLETTLDDQPPGAVGGTAGTQLGKEVGSDVFVGSLHALANLGKVGKDGLLVAFAQALGGRDLVGAGAGRGVVGVLLREQRKEAGQKRGIVDGLGLVVPPDAGALVHVAVLLVRGFLTLLALEREGLGLLGEVVVVLDNLLLLLLLHREVDDGVLGGGGIVTTIGVVVLLDDLLLLLLHEEVDAVAGGGSGIVCGGGGCVRHGCLLGIVVGRGHDCYAAVGVYYELLVCESNRLARAAFLDGFLRGLVFCRRSVEVVCCGCGDDDKEWRDVKWKF